MEWEGRVQRDDRGFTLVELMVALTVLATGIVAVVGVMNTSLTMVSGTSSRTRAVALATRELEEFRAIPYDTLKATVKNNGNNAVTTTETETFGGRTFQITKTLEWSDRGAKLQAYIRGGVSVAWTDSHGAHNVDQVTIVYPGGEGKYTGPEDLSDGTSTDTTAPPAPQNVTATAVATDPSTAILLTWLPGDPLFTVPVKHWLLQYTLDGVNWQPCGENCGIEVPLEQLSYVAQGLSADTAYTFRVAAVSESLIRSAWSSGVTLRTAATVSTTCAVGVATVTPNASRRINGNADAGIEHDPGVSVNSIGLCAGITIRYQPKQGVTREKALNPPLDGSAWTGSLNGKNDTWEMGVKDLFIIDANLVERGRIAFQVCAHNAKTCP